MLLNVPNAFIQTYAPIKDICKRVMMKVYCRLVYWLVKLDHAEYNNYILIENGQRVLYLIILKVIYGMLEKSMLWYRKVRKDLDSVGFRFNVYDACLPNRMVRN